MSSSSSSLLHFSKTHIIQYTPYYCCSRQNKITESNYTCTPATGSQLKLVLVLWLLSATINFAVSTFSSHFFLSSTERRNVRISFTLFFSFVTSLENRSNTKCLRTIYTAPIVFSLLFCLLGCWKFGQVHFLLRVPVFLSKSRCASSTISSLSSRPAVDFLAALCFHYHSIRNYRFSPLFSFFIFFLLFCVFILPNIFTGSILEHWSLYNSNISR